VHVIIPADAMSLVAPWIWATLISAGAAAVGIALLWILPASAR
jgi:hypothetical protein